MYKYDPHFTKKQVPRATVISRTPQYTARAPETARSLQLSPRMGEPQGGGGHLFLSTLSWGAVSLNSAWHMSWPPALHMKSVYSKGLLQSTF